MNYSELPRHNGNFWAAAWECWYGASERSCIATEYAWAATVTTARWYYRTFLGAQAVERYEVMGQLLGAIACWVYAHVKTWVDAQVDAAEAKPEETAEVLTAVSTPSLSFKDWVLVVVFKAIKAHATILQSLRPQQTVSSGLYKLQLRPCL